MLRSLIPRGQTYSHPSQLTLVLSASPRTADELLRLATDNDKKSEAHTYIGMNLRLKGADDEARPHFEWVKEYGNKRFYEYPLAIEELKRMGR